MSIDPALEGATAEAPVSLVAPAPASPTPRPRQSSAGQVPRHARTMHDVDWTMAHGPVMAAINSGGAVLCASMLGSLADAEPRYALYAGGIAGAGAAAGALRRGRTRVGAFARFVAFVAGGWWVEWAWSTSPWSPGPIVILVAVTWAFGLTAQEISKHEDDAAQRQEDEEAKLEYKEVAVEWARRIERVSNGQIKLPSRVRGDNIDGISHIETWPGETGMTMLVNLPGGGVTWRDVQGLAEALAADADLPAGCTVEVGPGETGRIAILRVQVVDRTAVKIPWPDDHEPLSISEPMPIGIRTNGDAYSVSLLDDPLLAVARRGSGKTNLLHVIASQGARCPNVIIWGIDLNGAGFTVPLLYPWQSGRAKRPVLDWVAATAEEADLMVATAIAIAERRKLAYAELMRDQDDTKLHPTSKLPMIVILVDEAKEAVGHNRGNSSLATALEKLIDIGRAMRVQVVLTALRGEAMTIPPAMKAQAGSKMVLRPTRDSEGEVANTLGWGLRGILTDVSKPGMALASTDGDMPTPIRIFEILPSQVDACAVATSRRRPALDEPSATVAGDAYARRWDRHRAWLEAQGVDTSTHVTVADDIDGDPNTTETGLTGDSAMTDEPMDLAGAMEGLAAANERMRKVREEHEARQAREAEGEAPLDEEAFAALAESASSPTDARQWVVTFLREAGPEGMAVDGEDGLLNRLERAECPVPRTTLYRRLGNDGAFYQPTPGRWAIKQE